MKRFFYFRRNMTGMLYRQRTSFPLFLAGDHLSDVNFATRSASASNDGAAFFTIW